MNKKKNLTTEEKFALAFQNHQKNNLKVAENLYKETLKENPNYFESIFYLGTLLAQTKRFDLAESLLHKAIEIQPNYVDAHYNLGLVFRELGKFQKEINCYEKAIEIQPNYAAAHNNLGNVLQELGEYQKAKNCYEKAIEIQPNYADAYYNLGLVFRELGKLQKAKSCNEKAIEIQPNFTNAHYNLGNVLQELGEYQKAKNCYEKAIEIQPNYADAHNSLGNVLQELGKHQKAISCYEKAIQIEPYNLTSYWLSMNTFPIIYKNLKEIDFYRKRFEDGIKKINQLLDTQSQYTKKQIIDAMKSSTNFYLSYQGRNDIKLQQKYANLIERLTEKIYPQFHQDRKINKSIEFIKIGFVSAFFKNHSIAKTHQNWILKIDKKIFKIFVYYIDDIIFDETTNSIKKHVNYFFNGRNIKEIIHQISKDDLDIIIYLDIGMHPNSQILGSLRLAPIQCLAMGHPVTSGFNNIDCVLSSELMEAKNGQDHYTEQLINLPNTGQCYELPVLTNLGTQNLTYKKDKIIFLIPQSLFKLLPRSDHIYVDIVKKYLNSQFWFISGVSEIITNEFKNRVMNCFKKNNLQGEKYIFFHPRVEQNKFFDLISKADIILDSFDWSGNNTSHEAISLDKPIVTLPAQFMRGRHTYSILKILGIKETIAFSEEEYVDIAVRLAKNNEFRNIIVNKIKKNKHKLFNDDKPIRFLEEVIRKKLLQLTQQSKPRTR